MGQVELTRPCPHCGNSIWAGATVCGHCHLSVTPLPTNIQLGAAVASEHVKQTAREVGDVLKPRSCALLLLVGTGALIGAAHFIERIAAGG